MVKVETKDIITATAKRGPKSTIAPMIVSWQEGDVYWAIDPSEAKKGKVDPKLANKKFVSIAQAFAARRRNDNCGLSVRKAIDEKTGNIQIHVVKHKPQQRTKKTNTVVQKIKSKQNK